MPRISANNSSSASPHIDASEAEAYDLPTDAEIDAELSRLEAPSGSGPGLPGYDRDPEAQQPFMSNGGGSMATASQYRLQRGERLRGVANRIIFSRYYVLFYGVMMVLSLATVVLSLMARNGCPSVAWHILEVVINALMVLEVGTRWVAYGKKYPMTPLNVIDLLLVLFCGITLIVTFTSPCSDGSMSEERLDTILLVVRNGVQFLRIVNILRRSGHSIFNPPKPIDLSTARPSALDMDLELDMSDDEEAAAERNLAGAPPGRTLAGGRYEAIPMFADGIADDALDGGAEGAQSREARRPMEVDRNKGRDGISEEDRDAWDRFS